MLQYFKLTAAPRDASVPEVSATASSIGRDIGAVLGAGGPASPRLLLQAVRATLCLQIALRDAAGVPDDERWHVAYDALDSFLDGCPRRLHATGVSAAFARLATFLRENGDLRRAPAFAERRPTA